MSYGMMGGGIYEIQFVAVNRMGGTVTMAGQQVQTLSYGFELAGQKAEQMGFRSMRAMQGLVFGLQMSTFYASMFMGALMKDDNALLSVEAATERYTKALRENGRGSEEARSAARSLEMAQNNLNRAQMMSTVLTASMGLQAVSLGMSFMQALPGITAMIAKLQTYIATSIIAQALTPGVGWAALGIGVGVAAGVGGILAYQTLTQPTPKVDVNVNMPEDDPYRAFARQKRNEITSTGLG